MWSYIVRIKMKDIGSDINLKRAVKILKSCNKDLQLGIKKKDYFDIVSDEISFDNSVYERLSSVLKNKIIGINVEWVHNLYSSKPEYNNDDTWNYYKNGREILSYKKGSKNKSFYYKVTIKDIDYDNLILETTVGKIIEMCGTDKNVIKFFNIKNIKNKKEIVNVKYLDCKDQFDSFELDYLFGDIKGRKEKKITYDEFIEFFDKSEVSVFRKDLDPKETIKKNGKDKSK